MKVFLITTGLCLVFLFVSCAPVLEHSTIPEIQETEAVSRDTGAKVYVNQKFYDKVKNSYYNVQLVSDTYDAHGSKAAAWREVIVSGKKYGIRPAFVVVHDFIGSTHRIAKTKGVAQAASVGTTAPNKIRLDLVLQYNVVGVGSVSLTSLPGFNLGSNTASASFEFANTKGVLFDWTNLQADPGLAGVIRSIRTTTTSTITIGSSIYATSATDEHFF